MNERIRFVTFPLLPSSLKMTTIAHFFFAHFLSRPRCSRCVTDGDHTLRILLYSLIFFLSVTGNLLIIVVLTVNKRMRTVTNTFLLSLAVSDLMMAVFCMPFTLIPSILQDFIFGAAMCKIVSYLMGEAAGRTLPCHIVKPNDVCSAALLGGSCNQRAKSVLSFENM